MRFLRLRLFGPPNAAYLRGQLLSACCRLGLTYVLLSLSSHCSSIRCHPMTFVAHCPAESSIVARSTHLGPSLGDLDTLVYPLTRQPPATLRSLRSAHLGIFSRHLLAHPICCGRLFTLLTLSALYIPLFTVSGWPRSLRSHRIATRRQKQDLSSLHKLGHFLKGSSASVGLVTVSSSCAAMQNYGGLLNAEGSASIERKEALEKCADLMPTLKKEQERAKKWLEDFYQEKW